MAKSLLPISLQVLIEQFQRLPGIGEKTAQKLAFAVLDFEKDDAEIFSKAILDTHKNIHYCDVCKNITDKRLCPICEDIKRDKATICVVQDTRYLLAIERTNEYNGVYHVLHGLISPMDKIGPDELYMKELIQRVSKDNVKEVIVATNANVEGEATALYLSRLLKPLGVKVSRIAYGIPVGGDLEYADEITIFKAMSGRNEI